MASVHEYEPPTGRGRMLDGTIIARTVIFGCDPRGNALRHTTTRSGDLRRVGTVMISRDSPRTLDTSLPTNPASASRSPVATGGFCRSFRSSHVFGSLLVTKTIKVRLSRFTFPCTSVLNLLAFKTGTEPSSRVYFAIHGGIPDEQPIEPG